MLEVKGHVSDYYNIPVGTQFHNNWNFTHFRLELLVPLRISSGFKFQFFRLPLTKPEMITNSNTTTLMQVNTLFTMADSFTPNASSPVNS